MLLNNSDADYTNVNEMAEIKKKSIRWIQKTAKKENWPVTVVNKRGDQRFLVSGLPEEIRVAVMEHRAKKGQNFERCGRGFVNRSNDYIAQEIIQLLEGFTFQEALNQLDYTKDFIMNRLVMKNINFTKLTGK